MSTRRITASTKAFYFVAFVVIIAAFLLLGGAPWIKEMMHGNRSMGMVNWNWSTILVCLGLGFLLGFLVFRRR